MRRWYWALVLMATTGCAWGCTAPHAQPTARSPLPNTPLPTIVNRGLAYGVPCKPPCWEGLVPGVSSEDEARRTMQQLYEEGLVPSYSCTQSACTAAGVRGSGMVVVSFNDGMVVSIRGRVGFDFDVSQLVELIGEPGGVRTTATGSGSDESCDVTDATGKTSMATPTHLLYPDLGAWFLALAPLGEGKCVCPDTVVAAFEYVPPMSMGELLDYLVSNYTAGLQGVREGDLIEWHGFGPGY